MSVLPNPKHEAIARSLSRGSSYEEAVALAGFTGINKTQAANLCKKPEIITRVNELNVEMDESLNDDLENIQGLDPDKVRKLLTENYLIKELIVSIKMSQQAGQFNATKALIELLGKEIGMFGGNGTAVADQNAIANADKTSLVINVLQNIHKIADMSSEMIDITPQTAHRLKTKVKAITDE